MTFTFSSHLKPELPPIFFSILCFYHFLLGILVGFFLHTKFQLQMMLGIYLKVHMMKRSTSCSFHHKNFQIYAKNQV